MENKNKYALSMHGKGGERANGIRTRKTRWMDKLFRIRTWTHVFFYGLVAAWQKASFAKRGLVPWLGCRHSALLVRS